MKLEQFKPQNAWNQLSDENKQRILDTERVGETYANSLCRCQGYTDMPLLLAHQISHVLDLPMNRFFELFETKN
jgi:hypothetical protein